MTHQVHIIGGGMAGSEAAWQLAQRGIRVRLSEMRGGGDTTAAHNGDGLADFAISLAGTTPLVLADFVL